MIRVGILAFLLGLAIGFMSPVGCGSIEETPEFSIGLPPFPNSSETDCAQLELDLVASGLQCIDDIGEGEYDARRQLWLDLITGQGLSADEAVAGFFAWVATQSEGCRTWINILERPAHICPELIY